MSPNLSGWLQFIALPATETLLLAGLAFLIARLLRSPHTLALLWQGTLLALAALWLAELGGLRFSTPAPAPAPRHLITHILVPDTAAASPLSVPAAPSAPTMDRFRPDPVWWPGILWLAGTAILLTRALGVRLWLACRRRREILSVDPQLLRDVEDLQTRLGLTRVHVQVWEKLRGPIAFGLWRQTIALPENFSIRFDAGQRRAVLAHELGHLAGRDAAWLCLSDFLCALAWWHPAVWWVRARLRSASEAAADETSALVSGGRAALAESLVLLGREWVTGYRAGYFGAAGPGLRSELARRITRLLSGDELSQPIGISARWWTRIGALLIAAALCVMPLGNARSLADFIPVSEKVAPANTPVVITAPRSDTDTQPAPSAVAEPEPPPLALATSAPLPTAPAAARAEIPEKIPSAENNTAPPPVPGAIPPAAVPVNDVPPNSEPVPAVTLEIHITEINEGNLDEIGLDWIFGRSPTNNPLPVVGAPGPGEPGGDSPYATNIRSARQTTQGEAVVLSASQFAALRRQLTARPGVDFLSAPRVTTLSGRQAQVSVAEERTAVIQAEPLGKGITYITTNLHFGPSVDVIPYATNGGWQLNLNVRLTEFLGYGDATPETITNLANGAKIKYRRPTPAMRVREIMATAFSRPGEIVALRGPQAESVILHSDKAVVLGDLPVLGRLFRNESRHLVRRRLYAFVSVQSNPAQ